MIDGRAVTLEWHEQIVAGAVGILRQAESMRMGLKHNPPVAAAEKRYAYQAARHVNAAGAEMAAAQYIGRYWYAGVNKWDECDVCPDIEVRHTDVEGGRLILRGEVKPDSPYVLVCGSFPAYEVIGWIYGRDATRKEWYKNPNGDGWCYMVPRAALRTDFHTRRISPETGPRPGEKTDEVPGPFDYPSEEGSQS